MRLLRSTAALVALLSLGVVGCDNCDLEVATTSLPDAQVGVFYQQFLASACGGDVWFLSGGSLPPGIGLRDDGLLSGTPTLGGRFSFTVGVFDFGSNEQAFGGLVLPVDEAE